MNNQPNAFFFEIQQISDNSPIFDQLKKQELFSYFQVDQKYYLFFYSQKSIDIDRIDSFIHILQELDTKQLKIRSLRGFFLYALEIMNNGKDLQILTTNLKPSFWRNLKRILRQNKKEVLLRFLFGRGYSSQASSPHLEDQIQTLQNQIDFLQPEAKTKPLTPRKLFSRANYTLKPNMGSYLQENDEKVNFEVREVQKVDSDLLSKASKSPLKTAERSEEYNILLNQNRSNFITLGKISEQQRVEIIKKGFQLQAEGRISLKKYYESTEEFSLFQSKEYSIK